MSDPFENLNKEFNIEGEIMKAEETVKEIRVASSDNQVRDDHEYARGNLYNLIERGQEAINDILDVAKQTNHPRAYEVAGNLIKNVADITDKLLESQRKLKEISEEKPKGPNVVNNSLFVGSTSELQKMLKQMSSDK
jgi:gas vesicle protein